MLRDLVARIKEFFIPPRTYSAISDYQLIYDKSLAEYTATVPNGPMRIESEKALVVFHGKNRITTLSVEDLTLVHTLDDKIKITCKNTFKITLL